MSSKDELEEKSSQAEKILGEERPRLKRSKRPSRMRRKFKRYMKENYEETLNTPYSVTPARSYAFNFFLFSTLGSLLPFLPIFYGLLGFSSLQNGLLYALRPLISFWCGPMIASVATNSKYRSLVLFLFLAGAVASTFCLSVVQTNEGAILESAACLPGKKSEIISPAVEIKPKNITQQRNIRNDAFLPSATWNVSTKDNNDLFIGNRTGVVTWKAFFSHSSKIFYRKLKQGILLPNLFLCVLALTAISEIFLSPTLHIAQASIRYNKQQSFFTNICLNRVFSKVGMIVSAITISFIAWKYKCIFSHVHYFYFHFYGFLATGCITALMALLLPREIPCKSSFFKAISTGCCYALSSCSNAGYIFGLWIAGMAEGAISAYLLWYAASNGANEMLIGMLVSLAMMTDLVLHWSVGMSTKWIGHSGLLCFGVFLMSVQFFLLTMINNPVYLIPTQLLFGLASSCIKSSLVSCAQSTGSKEMERVLCFVFQSAYLGLGLGLGGVFISMPYYVFGPKKTFAALSVLTITYTILHILIQCIACATRAKKPRNAKYARVATCESNNGDWLVDALEEEELRDLKEDYIVVDENVESQPEMELPNNNEEIKDLEKVLEVQ